MDACAVSIANGLSDIKISKRFLFYMSFLFGLFQGLMPFLGYLLGNAILEHISIYLPYLSFFILNYLGITMFISSFQKEEVSHKKITFQVLIFQAFATSIDALSVGFTMADYQIKEAILCIGIICLVTFIICYFGGIIGMKFGSKYRKYAQRIGAMILIIIGTEFLFPFIGGIL